MSNKPNVIIDNDTGYCKTGFSGEECLKEFPKLLLRD